MKIVLSRTDNLGDVILTLPMAGYLKSRLPDVQIYFIGKTYTKPIIEACAFVDYFLDKEEILANPDKLAEIQANTIIFVFPDIKLAKIAHFLKIPSRIGTSHRWFHWLYTNKRVNFSRKKSDLHEAQLNFKLLQPILGNCDLSLSELRPFFGLEPSENALSNVKKLITNKKNIIFHPKSKGSAREWTVENFYQLAQILPPTEYQIFITGVSEEGESVKKEKPEFFALPHVENLCGKLNLSELIAFISLSDGLVAASTGPLHIAAAMGKLAIGIYPPMRPIHPGRWQPIGDKAVCLFLAKNCEDCRKTQKCACMSSIAPQIVANEIIKNSEFEV